MCEQRHEAATKDAVRELTPPRRNVTAEDFRRVALEHARRLANAWSVQRAR